ncbi:extracellular catalytic domain type 1 short-chain-length polyhydroxyalkanoate depolymerase [Thermogemmatispora onikobensis]|uniref:extracellular catalytic domain type 1 short-chain-length polyhydroxyalkanoate depolymerase n=1 Tax=Thermogemmatispora onikobensis TaxID=732234 RepID=UPI00159F1E55|nr:PHB depolymerase family esterase [Thermogemmatispora onikobensis]
MQEARWRGTRVAWVIFLLLVLLSGCHGNNASDNLSGSGSPESNHNSQATTAPTGASQKSQGCGQPAPARGTTLVATLQSGRVTRSYRLHIPPGYQPDQPLPLVLNFHGHGSNGQQQETYTGFSSLADRANFLVVYPDGVLAPDGKTGWNAYGPHPTPVDDVRFTSDLLQTLERHWCLDLRRIFATGLSNGGGLTALLACRLSTQIAAFAPVAGAFYPLPGGCHPQRSVPLLEIHGTGDFIVPYEGMPGLGLPPIPQWLEDWARRDGCQQGPTVFLTQSDITGEAWSHCTAPGLVVHYRVAGGGHTWPGSLIPVPYLGKTTHTLSATAVIWQFFVAHPLPSIKAA